MPDVEQPGSIILPFQPQEIAETWRMLAADPFSSPDTQRLASLSSFWSTAGQPPDLALEHPKIPAPAQASRGGGRQVVPSTAPDYSAPSGEGITYSGQKATHPTDGLKGYPAVDIFAPAGTAFEAPEDGRVVRHSGRGGTSGNVYGYSVWFVGVSGRKYFITHLNEDRAPKGRYKKGQPLGTVSRWSGGSPHAHVGVRR